MAEEKDPISQELQQTQPPQETTYASPLKRIWAWVGVVYMVIIVLLVTYMLATASYIQGIAGLMVLPALGGVIASTVWLWRQGRRKDALHAVIMVLIIATCAVLMVLGLITGIPALLANFGA